MKPFRILTELEQRERYKHTLNRSFAVAQSTLRQKYWDQLREADKLFEKAKSLSEVIDRIEDRVANKADCQYKTWTWRHDPKKLKRVCDSMIHASQKMRDRQAAMFERAAKLREPYIEELDKLHALKSKLEKEAR